jgi:hypothetical protein
VRAGGDERSDAMGAAIRAAAAEVSAPLTLRERLAGEGRAAGRQSRRRWFAAGTLAVAAAAVAVALILAGAGGGPQVSGAADVALAQPVGPQPATSAKHPNRLKAEVDGVAFPSWKGSEYRAAAVADREVGGRVSTVVWYRGPGGTSVGYVIVPGDSLPTPDGTRTVSRAGVDFAVGRRTGGTVVSWERGGHTCVVAARGVPARTLVSLAAGGQIT